MRPENPSERLCDVDPQLSAVSRKGLTQFSPVVHQRGRGVLCEGERSLLSLSDAVTVRVFSVGRFHTALFL